MPKFKPTKKKKEKSFSLPKIKKPKFLKKLEWLDPFHYVDLFVMPRVKKITDSELVEGVVNVFFALIFAAALYFILGLAFGTTSPLVIVYSESMEPTFFRGDVMGLTQVNDSMNFGDAIVLNENIKGVPVEKYLSVEYFGGTNSPVTKIIFKDGQEIIPTTEGSVIVYPSYPYGIPIIHRAIVKIKANDGTFLLTKGDNKITNFTFDQDCGKIDILRQKPSKGCITFFAVPVQDVQGVAFFRVPVVGCVKLWLVDDLFSIVTTGKLPKDFKGIC